MKIKEWIHKKAIYVSNNQFCRFLMVGSFITITNIVFIFILYNFFNLGYWASSAIGYTIVTFISYYLNRKFTFKCRNGSLRVLCKFVSIIALCYFFSYFIAKPLTIFVIKSVFDSVSINIIEQIAMLVGMAGSVILNYIGQKIIVFR